MRYIFVWSPYLCDNNEVVNVGEYIEDDPRLLGQQNNLLKMGYAVYSDEGELDIEEFDNDQN